MNEYIIEIKVNHVVNFKCDGLNSITLFVNNKDFEKIGLIDNDNNFDQNQLKQFMINLENAPILKNKHVGLGCYEYFPIGYLPKSFIQEPGVYIKKIKSGLKILGVVWDKFYNSEDELFIAIEI
jgi:hypothetical protein